MTPTPFHFIRELVWCNDEGAEAVWRPTGDELGPLVGADRPPSIPGTLLLEALAQCAGLCLQRTHGTPGSHWMLTGVDDADVDHIGWGIRITLTCMVYKRSTRAAVLIVSAATGQGEVCHATILMHRI